MAPALSDCRATLRQPRLYAAIDAMLAFAAEYARDVTLFTMLRLRRFLWFCRLMSRLVFRLRAAFVTRCHAAMPLIRLCAFS